MTNTITITLVSAGNYSAKTTGWNAGATFFVFGNTANSTEGGSEIGVTGPIDANGNCSFSGPTTGYVYLMNESGTYFSNVLSATAPTGVNSIWAQVRALVANIPGGFYTVGAAVAVLAGLLYWRRSS